MLKIKEVSVVYPDKTKAISNVSFTLNEGDNIALIGENGAGKTSLLLAIVGILKLDKGIVEVNSQVLSKDTLDAIRMQIGFVFQNPDDQLFMPRVYDDVAFGCRNMGLTEEVTSLRVKNTLLSLGIDHLIMKSSLRLSGGEKRMAAIATVLAMNPSILLFDEPTAFLDPKAKRLLAESLNVLTHPKIIASHDLAFVKDICNRVIVIKDGHLQADTDISILNDKQALESYGL